MRYLICYMIGIGLLSGCNGFLDESSQSEVRPTTVSELYQVMLGEAYPRATATNGEAVMNYLEFFTDNIQANPVVNDSETSVMEMDKCLPLFAWENEMYEKCATIGGLDTWDLYYKRINGCNVILDYIDRVTGEYEQKQNMIGQVLVLRGWWYLQLVNLYGLPYNVGDPHKNLGVPLKLDMDVTDRLYARNTVAEVYAQIEKDLLAGITILKKYGTETSKWKMSALSGMALLSRVYLYMEKWEKSVAYADSVLRIQNSLCKFDRFDDLEEVISKHAVGVETHNGVYNAKVSNEIIWMYGTAAELSLYTSFSTYTGNPAAYTVSEDLINCFETVNAPENDPDIDAGDLRRLYQIHYGSYYSSGDIYFPYWVSKHGRTTISSFSESAKGIRTAELYLNRAEAYIQQYRQTGNVDFREKALVDLNTLREARFDTRNVAYIPIEERGDLALDDAEKLYDFCLKERRRELMFEDHRWFDLRRTGMPRLEHVVQVKQGEPIRTFVLEANSSHYVLPIPERVLRDNAKLEQNKYND